MTSEYAMATEITEQADVDRAFADYELAMLTVNSGKALTARNRLLCVNCSSADYSYNNTGANEPGRRVCNNCGVVEQGCIFFQTMFGRTVPTRSSNYKRIHHWHERISQLLLFESQIPVEHMLAIGQKLLDGSHAVVSKDAIRKVLRSLGLQVYIEKWLQIIYRCTGVMPPCPGPMVLNRLDELFIELQRPFNAHKLANRRNFLNYNYVFCRLFQRMNCTKFCMFFPLIRSKIKLKALDDMWAAMVTSIDWESPPLIHVATFSVKIDSPDELLRKLAQRCACAAPVAPRTIPMKTAIQTWGRRYSAVPRPEKEKRRLLPLEQQPQTLSLRLKRRRSNAA